VGICINCHPAKDTPPVSHGAILLGGCGRCHDTHGSPNRDQLVPFAKTCCTCHADDIAGQTAIHAPEAAGYCHTCHDPHSTDSPWG